jgi:hypothetical protein
LQTIRAPEFAPALDSFATVGGEAPALRLRTQASKLLYVMEAMHQMKLPPLGCRERAEDGMIEKFLARSEFLFAAANNVVHLCDLRANFGTHSFGGDSAGASDGRGFPAGGQMAEPHNHKGSASLCPSLSGGQGLAGFDDALESLDGARIS